MFSAPRASSAVPPCRGCPPAETFRVPKRSRQGSGRSPAPRDVPPRKRHQSAPGALPTRAGSPRPVFSQKPQDTVETPRSASERGNARCPKRRDLSWNCFPPWCGACPNIRACWKPPGSAPQPRSTARRPSTAPIWPPPCAAICPAAPSAWYCGTSRRQRPLPPTCWPWAEWKPPCCPAATWCFTTWRACLMNTSSSGCRPCGRYAPAGPGCCAPLPMP